MAWINLKNIFKFWIFKLINSNRVLLLLPIFFKIHHLWLANCIISWISFEQFFFFFFLLRRKIYFFFGKQSTKYSSKTISATVNAFININYIYIYIYMYVCMYVCMYNLRIIYQLNNSISSILIIFCFYLLCISWAHHDFLLS